MRDQLMAPFRERFFTWRPYLYRYDLHERLEPLERALIAEGAIQATGFRWVGERTRVVSECPTLPGYPDNPGAANR